MSVLLIGLERSPGEQIVSLLVQEGDDVRVLTDRSEDTDRWKQLGAHVATGSLDDADLIERAAQACRSVVVAATGELHAVAAAAHAAGVDRLILLASSLVQAEEARRAIGDVDHVILVTRKQGLLRRAIPAADLAVAVSAADDLAGKQRLIADLGEAPAWAALRIERL